MAPRGLLDLITLVDNVPLAFEADCAPYYRLFLAPDPRPHGYLLPATVASMPWPASFTVSHARRSVTLSPPPPPPGGSSLSEHANAAFQAAVDAAIDADVFAVLHRTHSEPFRVLGARGFVQVERFAASLFGIASRGAHLTGYVRDSSPSGGGGGGGGSGGLRIWVARRSRSLFTYPGLLDSTVAGGVKADDTPLDCIVAEAVEEASLDAAWVRSRVRAAGTVTLANRHARSGLFHSEVLYVYDLEMPAPGSGSGSASASPTTPPSPSGGDRGAAAAAAAAGQGGGGTIPVPGDDEVEEFVLMPVAEVRERMLAGEFKPNVCAVIIDFLIRHGELTPEGEGDYVQICERLRRRVPVPTSAEMEWP